jgi:small-conductance mechanosensitive channel
MRRQFAQLLDQLNLPAWAGNLIIVATSLALGLLLKLLLSIFVRKKAEEAQRFSIFHSLLKYLGTPLTFFIPVLVFNLLLSLMYLPAPVLQLLAKLTEITLTILFAWALIRFISVVQDFVIHRFDIKKENNLRERKLRTQLQFIRRFLMALIVVLTIAAILLSFSTMRKIGAGLLTGVGIGGIIIGFAAQRSLGNLLAGFQIAFTQPIRIDDAVVVENEWGIIEEITLTYVVVRIWDERRLILPINYFIEKPFQNWTRTSSQILGTVLLYVDYTTPVQPVRDELTRLLKENKLWDGRVNALQVTNISERTVELRALMSARNSGQAFDLRCYVRENLLRFITSNYKDALPKDRTIMDGITVTKTETGV